MQIIENQFDLQFTIYDLQLGLLPYHYHSYHSITLSLYHFPSSFSSIFCSSCPVRAITRTLLTLPKSVASFIFNR